MANYMRIDWQTVGSCIFRSLRDLEPERAKRLDGLVNIGIDETSYRKGHKYITVVVNHDTKEIHLPGRLFQLPDLEKRRRPEEGPAPAGCP